MVMRVKRRMLPFCSEEKRDSATDEAENSYGIEETVSILSLELQDLAYSVV